MDTTDTAGPADDAGDRDGASIDALYGLEPVYEPAHEASSSADGTKSDGTKSDGTKSDGTQLEVIACPYCGEPFQTLLDLSAGSASYIEDCQICCQPIQFALDVDPDGTLVALTVRRGDE